MEMIDVWMQHPTPRFMRDPMFDSLKRWLGSSLSLPKEMPSEFPLELAVGAMDHAGVRLGLLSAWYGPQGVLISNDDVRACVQKFPERFVGVAGVDLRDPVTAVRELRHYVREYGFKALRIVQWLWDLPCSHALYYPLLTECVELRIPVCLQVGLTGPLRSSETGRPIHIERIALDFPDLKIVCGHIGYPWHTEMIAFATKFPNVYLDTSAYKSSRYPAELIHYMKHHGKKKVMFGSNFPMLLPAMCLQDLDALELDEEVKRLFFYENAKAVFQL